MSSMLTPYAYSKMDNEDPEEKRHRIARFLIYKALERADSRKSASCLKLRICKLKVKIGRKMKRLRKARAGLFRQVAAQFKAWQRLFRSGETVLRIGPLLV